MEFQWVITEEWGVVLSTGNKITVSELYCSSQFSDWLLERQGYSQSEITEIRVAYDWLRIEKFQM